MRITAAVIMRNEAVPIASKLALCASWADEIVVIDQRSEDGSVFIAREALRLLAVDRGRADAGRRARQGVLVSARLRARDR